MSSASSPLSRVGIALHFAVLAGTFVALAAWTWGTWPDVLIDFGRELYVPWQLSQGEQLYVDVAYFNGPLSPQWNALLFSTFGVGLSTLVWSNLALFVALLALLHYVLRAMSTPLAATAACVVVMCTSGFGQLVGIGNYNYVCPYSHEATHGLLLGIAALACVQRARGRLAWIALAGACVGLAFLTKPETFLAAFAGAATSIALRPRPAAAAITFVAAALATVVVAWVWLALASSAEVASTGTLGAWPSLFSSDVSELKFYRAGMGLDAPGPNLRKLCAWGAGTVGLLVPSVAIARYVAPRLGARIAAPFAFASTAAVMFGLHTRVPWLQAARPWPLFALAVLAVALLRWRRARDDSRTSGAAAFAVFSLALLAKMLLNARLIQYGFALAMPATALIAVAMVAWLPAAAARHAHAATVARAGVAALLLGFCAIHLQVTSKNLARKAFVIGEGVDTFRCDVRGDVVAHALRWVRDNVPIEHPTLAVLPEGVTINYLARLDNPTPYVNFMPPELVLFGEDAIVAAFDAHPPDVVMLVHKNTAEYGLPWFGRDYGAGIWKWLSQHYQNAALFGDPPLEPGSSFGIGVLVRRH